MAATTMSSLRIIIATHTITTEMSTTIDRSSSPAGLVIAPSTPTPRRWFPSWPTDWPSATCSTPLHRASTAPSKRTVMPMAKLPPKNATSSPVRALRKPWASCLRTDAMICTTNRPVATTNAIDPTSPR